LLFLFCGTRVWTQSFVPARQVLHHLSHTASLLWLFWRWGFMNYLSMILLISVSQVVKITAMTHWHQVTLTDFICISVSGFFQCCCCFSSLFSLLSGAGDWDLKRKLLSKRSLNKTGRHNHSNRCRSQCRNTRNTKK
jgi:hypothetical protein